MEGLEGKGLKMKQETEKEASKQDGGRGKQGKG